MLQNKAYLITALRSLTLREKILTINILLYFCVGGGILYRAFFRHASWPAYLMGSIFLLLGSYRFYMVYKALAKGGGPEVPGK